MNLAIWHARCIIARGHQFTDQTDLFNFLQNHCDDIFCNRSPINQRHVRDPEPLLPAAILYRSDGAARGQGNDADVSKCGFGCICYDSSYAHLAWMSAQLPDATSNNVAEYYGLQSIIHRIERLLHPYSIVEVDSLLVCKQVNCEWRCLDLDLQRFFNDIHVRLRNIRAYDCTVIIRHIYREHDTDADSLANAGQMAELSNTIGIN